MTTEVIIGGVVSNAKLPRRRPMYVVALAAKFMLVLGLTFGLAQPTLQYYVPNPFRELTYANVNDYYHIRAIQYVDQHETLIEEFFSLGQGLTYIVHTDLAAKKEPWAILVDGRSDTSYILHNLFTTDEQELDCELDRVHTHKRLYPWQYAYNVDEIVSKDDTSGSSSSYDASSQRELANLDTASSIGMLPEIDTRSESTNTNSTKRPRRSKRNKVKGKKDATIYGLGAIWLNFIREGISSTWVGSGSPYPRTNVWRAELGNIEMQFEKTAKELSAYGVNAQRELDKTKPVQMTVASVPLNSANTGKLEIELVKIDKFIFGLNEQKDIRLQRLGVQLELCKKASHRHRQFPNLMRALTDTSDRVYQINYVMHRYNSYGLGKLDDGAYNKDYHRFMWPYELTVEIFSLAEQAQTIIYDPGFKISQAKKRNSQRKDVFMVRFATNEQSSKSGGGNSVSHAPDYYHLIVDSGDTLTCTRGEHEPKPLYRMFSRPLTFETNQDVEYKANIHGLGALLLNAANMRYKSFSLFSMDIQVPDSVEEGSNGRHIRADVWQVIDKRDKVRVLFFFERRDPNVEKYQWDLAQHDRNDLARLVRIDVREAKGEKEWTYAVNQDRVNDERDLLVQYHIFSFQFGLAEHEAEFALQVPKVCREGPAHEPDSSSTEEQEQEDQNPIEDTEGKYDKIYASDNDSDDADYEPDDDEKNELDELAAEFEQIRGLETSNTPLPEFDEMLDTRTSYTILTKIERIDEPHNKAIWLEETMDLLTEKLSLKIYRTHENLKNRLPDEQYVIYYESELILYIAKGKGCSRVGAINDKWLRLFSGHLTYYAVVPMKEGKLDDDISKNELVVESNRLSSYGLGALWRRASQSELAEFLGTRRERVKRDGRMYKQLEWLYEEFDMTIRWTFLLEDSAQEIIVEGHKRDSKPQLESVVISNKWGRGKYGKSGSSSSSFKEVKASVQYISTHGRPMLTVPAICQDEILQAKREFEYAQKIRPPDVETVLGKSGLYEIEYMIYKSKQSASSRRRELSTRGRRSRQKGADGKGDGEGGIQVRESFDRQLNRGKMVIEGESPEKRVEVYVDGQSKRIFAMIDALSTCTILSADNGAGMGAFLRILITDNPEADPSKMFGVLGMWQQLATQDSRLRVKQFYDYFGSLHEDEIYSVQLAQREAPEGRSGGQEVAGYSEISMQFEKRQPHSYFVKPKNFDQASKTKIREEHDYKLARIEVRHIGNELQQQRRPNRDDESEYIRIIVDKQQDYLSDEWQLPEACKKLIQPTGGDGPTTGPSDSSTSTDDDRPPSAGEFPKLSKLLQNSNQFHMRSEVNTLGNGGTSNVYLVHELYNSGSVRIQTHRLGKDAGTNCDLLMPAGTYDQFDLSLPFQCYHLRVDRLVGKCLRQGLMEVWMRNSAELYYLYELYYGPLSLWKFAENGRDQGRMSVKLIKTVDLTSVLWASIGDASLETFKKQLEYELDREVWLVSGIESGDTGREWSYEMQFVKQQRSVRLDDGRQGLEKWHVLESIRVLDCDTRFGDKYSTKIEVVNYSDQPGDATTFNELFLLPEGWNCPISSKDNDTKKTYEYNLDLDYDLHIDYEASLELFDTSKVVVYEDTALGYVRALVPRGDGELPTLMGKFVTGDYLAVDPLNTIVTDLKSNETEKRGSKGLGLSIHQSTARFLDGSSLTNRIITDQERSLEYELDMMSGACMINYVLCTNWRLSFPSGTRGSSSGKTNNKTHIINLLSNKGPLSDAPDDDLFKRLFVDNNDYFVVNKYSREHLNGRVLYLSYERELDSLRLTNDLEGPARIVRKYEQLIDYLDTKRSVQRVNFMKVQVYLLNRDKTKLRALLTMPVRVHQALGLRDFLELASVSDCFNEADPLAQRQLASFALEYPVENQFSLVYRSHSRTMESVLREIFYGNLLRLGGGTKQLLSPLQLDGRAHLEFNQHDRTLRIDFNVLEAPSAMIYFNRRFECTMNERIEAVAESRLLSSVAACSRWCDQMRCLSMSYCQDDRQCRVATEAGVFGPRHIARKKSDIELASDLTSLAACSRRPSCIYYYNKSGKRAQTLAGLRDYLDVTVNKKHNRKQLKTLGLPLDLLKKDSLLIHNRVVPTRFFEARDVFRWQHEDYDDPFEAENESSESSSSSSFGNSSAGLLLTPSRFAVWKVMSQFATRKLDMLNEKLSLKPEDSKFTIKSIQTSSPTSCLQECQRSDCLLVATCKHQQGFENQWKKNSEHQKHCELLSATGSKSIMSLGALKSELIDSDAPQCSISIRDHLDKFHMFENSRKPAKYWQKLEDYTAQECAAACHLNKADCLSFDLCTSFADGAIGAMQQAKKSVCFLQRDHVTQDSFDRSVLLSSDIDSSSTNQNTIDGRQVDCDHYSKSLLAEFRRVPNAKVKELHGSILRGISVDRCAVDCLRDDACRAFEHCQNPNRQPTQSCYLIRAKSGNDTDWLQVNPGDTEKKDAESESNVNSDESRIKEMREHIILSRSCSIYVANEALKRGRIEQTLTTTDDSAPTTSPSSSHSTMVIFICLLIAILLGALLQFSYIRLTGRPLSLARAINN